MTPTRSVRLGGVSPNPNDERGGRRRTTGRRARAARTTRRPCRLRRDFAGRTAWPCRAVGVSLGCRRRLVTGKGAQLCGLTPGCEPSSKAGSFCRGGSGAAGAWAVRTRTHPRADAGPVFGPAGRRQSHVYMDAEHVLRPQDTRKEGSYARSMDLSLPEIRSDGGSRHSRPRATVASRPGTNGSQGRG